MLSTYDLSTFAVIEKDDTITQAVQIAMHFYWYPILGLTI